MLGYITRDYKSGIVYDGTNLNKVLDWEESLRFKKENVEYREYVLVGLYGEDYIFKFPHSSADLSVKQLIAEWWKDITDEWYEKVIELSLLGYVNDYTLGAHKALTQSYYIMYKKQIGWEELYTLCERENVSLTLDATNKTGDADEDNPEPKPDIQAQNKKDGYLIMMKEAMMGYYNSDPLKYRSKGDKNEQSFDIGQTYEFQLSSEMENSYSKTLTIEGNYTAALRYQMLNKALQEWNANPRYRMHQRNSLLQWWQKDMLKRMWRKTVVLVPRRSWKTVIMTLEILKEMLAHNYKAGTRPRTVIFISKDFDAVTQVMDYIKSLINDFDWLKTMFNYNSTDHIFSLDTYDNNGKKQTISQCKFYSALWKLPWVGDAADAVFIDEAMLVPTRVKDKLMSIVNHEWARFLAMSTFYSEDEDGVDRLYYWPIEMCNKYEKESSKILDIDNHIFKMYLDFQRNGNIPDESAGLRYTIDDVEVIIDKDWAKRELADKPENFMRELYCRLSERTTVFNYKPYIVPVSYTEFPSPRYLSGRGDNQEVFKPEFKRLVTAYDPAQTGDISAFLVTWYDEKRGKVCVIKEHQLNYKDKSSFIPQAKEIMQILTDLQKFKCPIMKCIDSTHQAVVDVMWSQRVFFQYLYYRVGGDSVKKWARPSEERVPKKLMVEALQTMFDNNKIEIWDSECPNLIEQLDAFVEYKNDYTNRSKYEGEKGIHDDYVACLLMAAWTYWDHLGLSHNAFTIDAFKEEQMRLDNESDPMHLLEVEKPQVRYEAVENSFWW